MNIVIYHKDCMDGFAAAYCAWKIMSDVEFIPCQYGDPVPEVGKGNRIYIVDFSFNRQTLLDMAEHNYVLVLDHHKTAKENLEGLTHPNLQIQFDMNQSGAMLAYKHFILNHPQLYTLISYIQDRDLWTKRLNNTEEVSAALTLYPKDFITFDYLVNHVPLQRLVKEGSIVLTYQQQIIESMASKAKMHTIWCEDVPTVNSAILQSEIGHRLLQLYPDAKFAAIYFHLSPTERVYSLRSRGDYDVSNVAQQFGGGGHAPAASFKILERGNGFVV